MNKIRSSLVDGRLENARYRQDQLHHLHAVLRENVQKLCGTLEESPGYSKASAEMEFYLTMDSIVQTYKSLDFDKELEKEYLVANGQNNTERRAGVGLIAIRPSTHSRLYSTITPLAVAIASKNCVFLEIGEPSHEVDKILTELLSKTLDRSLYGITPKFTESEVMTADLFLDGTCSEIERGSNDLRRSTGRSISVVERSGDLRKAAEEIFRSRQAPNHTSPYSPSLVIVNRFIQAEFINACSEFQGEGTFKPDISTPGKHTNSLVLHQELIKLETKGSIKIRRPKTSSGLTFIEITDSSCALDYSHIGELQVVLLPTNGVVDTTTTQFGLPSHAATYIFADPATAKFLGERIASEVSYINQIPQQLLIGPLSFPHSLHPRYTVEMFSIPRPVFTQPQSLTSDTEKLKQTACQPLEPTGQKMGHAVGFFEQGILIGLSLAMLVVLPSTAWLTWMAGKRVISAWR